MIKIEESETMRERNQNDCLETESLFKSNQCPTCILPSQPTFNLLICDLIKLSSSSSYKFKGSKSNVSHIV